MKHHWWEIAIVELSFEVVIFNFMVTQPQKDNTKIMIFYSLLYHTPHLVQKFTQRQYSSAGVLDVLTDFGTDPARPVPHP